MIRFIYLLTLSFATTIVLAQPPINKDSKSFSDGLGAADYSFNVGSSVGSSFNNSFYFNNYFSPNAKFDLTKKVSLVVGVGVSYTQLNNFPVYNNEFKNERTDGSQTSFFTYASGIYKLNNKVNLNATVYLEDAIINTPNSPALSQQYKDVSVGINYNVNKHFSINAQMQLSNRPYQNSYQNGYSGFGHSSPFGYSPFF